MVDTAQQALIATVSVVARLCLMDVVSVEVTIARAPVARTMHLAPLTQAPFSTAMQLANTQLNQTGGVVTEIACWNMIVWERVGAVRSLTRSQGIVCFRRL